MTMTITVLDLILIGSTSGLTTFFAIYSSLRLMKHLEVKRKRILIQEMLSQMHDKAKTEFEFEEIVDRIKKQSGERDE